MGINWRGLFIWQNVVRFAGLVGIAFEALSGIERPSLLLIYAAMIGLPDMIRHDERPKNGNGASA